MDTLPALTARCNTANLSLDKWGEKDGWPLVVRPCYADLELKVQRAAQLKRPMLLRGLRRVGKSMFLVYLEKKNKKKVVWETLSTSL